MVAVLGLGFIGFIIWFVIIRTPGGLPTAVPAAEQVGSLPATVPTPAAQPAEPETAPAPTAAAISEAVERETVAALAKSFSERYASHSTASDFSNVEDLLPLMTADFAATSRASIDAGRAKASAAKTFSATASRALRATVTAYDGEALTAKADVLLQVQELTSGAATGSVSYRTMALALAKDDGTWKVASAKLRDGQ